LSGAGRDYRGQASAGLQTHIHFKRPDPSTDCYIKLSILATLENDSTQNHNLRYGGWGLRIP
ncbi:MAG: hypothetical protein AAF959_22510, partial [Cyanobacteria bacterium P01_D01_bin.56]